MPFRRFPLVLVEWLDHTDGGNEWQDPNEEMEVHHCFSVGWVVGEDDLVLKVVPHLGVDEEGESLQYSGPMKIVKSTILRRIPINLKRK